MRTACGCSAPASRMVRAFSSPGAPRLLVIEDTPRDRDWLVHTLTAAGYSVEDARTGAEATALRAAWGYEQARGFAEVVARVVAGAMPNETTLERNTEKRGRGKIYIDYSQNAYGRPLASAYSVRPFAQATVSAPVSLEELKRGLTPERFTIKTMPARLKKTGDLWAEFWNQRQAIEPALMRLRDEMQRKKPKA